MNYYIDLTSPGYFWQMRSLEKGIKLERTVLIRPVFLKLLMASICLFVLFYR